MAQGKRIGELLIAEGLITEIQLEQALAAQKRDTRRVGQILLGMEALVEIDLLRVLAEQMKLSYLDLPNYLIDPVVARIIPEHISRRHCLIAINKVGNRLTVAMDDPLNIIAIDDIQLMTGLTVKAVLCSKAAIEQALDDSFRVFPAHPSS